MIKGCRTLQIKLKDNIGHFKKAIQMKRLEKYAEIISSVLSSYNRKSHDKTMMIKGTRKFREDTTNRKTHQEDVEGIVTIIAKKKSLNEKVAGIMARNHDIGHTFMGHSGEWWISNVLENNGLGVVCHNAIGARELIYRNDVYNEILKKIQFFYPNITEKELKKVENSLWLIMDAINAHNGERCCQEFVPQVLKTEKDFEEELTKCFTIKGFDRTIEPATIEGCLMRLADQISYIPSDMADGLKERFIEGLDEEYIIELEKLGITKQEVKECILAGKYDELAKRVRDIFCEDLDKNSTKKKISMSDEVFKVMKNIKKINDRQIVDWVLPDIDLEIYPQSVDILISKYTQTIIQNDMISKISTGKMNADEIKEYRDKYKDTPYIGLIEYLANMPKKDYDNTKKDTEQAIIESVRKEQEQARQIVIEGREFVEEKGFEKRDARISEYIRYYKNKLEAEEFSREYPEDQIKRDILDVIKNNLAMSESLAMTMGAKYLATLSDREFFNQLLEFGIIGLDEKEELTVKYKNVDLRNRNKKDENWEKVRQLFDEEEEEIG